MIITFVDGIISLKISGAFVKGRARDQGRREKLAEGLNHLIVKLDPQLTADCWTCDVIGSRLENGFGALAAAIFVRFSSNLARTFLLHIS